MSPSICYHLQQKAELLGIGNFNVQILSSSSCVVRSSKSFKMLKIVMPFVRRSLWMPSVLARLRPSLYRPAVQNFLFGKFNGLSNSVKTRQSDTKSQTDSSSSAGEVDQEGLGGGEDLGKKLMEEVDKAESEKADLLSQNRDVEDKYKRALAETENLRARLTKQIDDYKLYAIQGFCKDVSEISDILRMAIGSVPKDQVTKDNPHLKNLFDGLELTETRLLQVFKSHGLTKVNPVDEKFNPNEHEAVVQQEVEGKEPGTVIFVTKIGYRLHDRVIRPAVVGVAK